MSDERGEASVEVLVRHDPRLRFGQRIRRPRIQSGCISLPIVFGVIDFDYVRYVVRTSMEDVLCSKLGTRFLLARLREGSVEVSVRDGQKDHSMAAFGVLNAGLDQ